MSKHLDLNDRITLSQGLESLRSMSDIAHSLGKAPSTISREILKHRVAVFTKVPYRVKNCCLHRHNCHRSGLCESHPDCTRYCSTCSHCNDVCNDFVEEVCPKLSLPPYVCNGCASKSSCVLRKYFYDPKDAQKQYVELLKSAREGYNMTPDELSLTDQVVSPLLKQGQSVHHIVTRCGDGLTVSESTIVRLIRDRQLSATVLDQQRVVKMKPRKNCLKSKQVDRTCRKGRTMTYYEEFCNSHLGVLPPQMDSVIGSIGGKSLLTFIFPSCEFMLAFLCTCHTAAAVQEWIEKIYAVLSPEEFYLLFPAILTDNGTEFSNPAALETATDGSIRTHIFYCDPMASWQKGQVERNHEFIRMILPKGTSFNRFEQKDIGLMMSHINSYSRASLGNHSPMEVFGQNFGQTILEKLLRLSCQNMIPPEKIILKPSLLR